MTASVGQDSRRIADNQDECFRSLRSKMEEYIALLNKGVFEMPSKMIEELLQTVQDTSCLVDTLFPTLLELAKGKELERTFALRAASLLAANCKKSSVLLPHLKTLQQKLISSSVALQKIAGLDLASAILSARVEGLQRGLSQQEKEKLMEDFLMNSSQSVLKTSKTEPNDDVRIACIKFFGLVMQVTSLWTDALVAEVAETFLPHFTDKKNTPVSRKVQSACADVLFVAVSQWRENQNLISLWEKNETLGKNLISMTCEFLTFANDKIVLRPAFLETLAVVAHLTKLLPSKVTSPSLSLLPLDKWLNHSDSILTSRSLIAASSITELQAYCEFVSVLVSDKGELSLGSITFSPLSLSSPSLLSYISGIIDASHPNKSRPSSFSLSIVRTLLALHHGYQKTRGNVRIFHRQKLPLSLPFVSSLLEALVDEISVHQFLLQRELGEEGEIKFSPSAASIRNTLLAILRASSTLEKTSSHQKRRVFLYKDLLVPVLLIAASRLGLSKQISTATFIRSLFFESRDSIYTGVSLPLLSSTHVSHLSSLLLSSLSSPETRDDTQWKSTILSLLSSLRPEFFQSPSDASLFSSTMWEAAFTHLQSQKIASLPEDDIGIFFTPLGKIYSRDGEYSAPPSASIEAPKSAKPAPLASTASKTTTVTAAAVKAPLASSGTAASSAAAKAKAKTASAKSAAFMNMMKSAAPSSAPAASAVAPVTPTQPAAAAIAASEWKNALFVPLAEREFEYPLLAKQQTTRQIVKKMLAPCLSALELILVLVKSAWDISGHVERVVREVMPLLAVPLTSDKALAIIERVVYRVVSARQCAGRGRLASLLLNVARFNRLDSLSRDGREKVESWIVENIVLDFGVVFEEGLILSEGMTENFVSLFTPVLFCQLQNALAISPPLSVTSMKLLHQMITLKAPLQISPLLKSIQKTLIDIPALQIEGAVSCLRDLSRYGLTNETLALQFVELSVCDISSIRNVIAQSLTEESIPITLDMMRYIYVLSNDEESEETADLASALRAKNESLISLEKRDSYLSLYYSLLAQQDIPIYQEMVATSIASIYRPMNEKSSDSTSTSEIFDDKNATVLHLYDILMKLQTMYLECVKKEKEAEKGDSGASLAGKKGLSLLPTNFEGFGRDEEALKKKKEEEEKRVETLLTGVILSLRQVFDQNNTSKNLLLIVSTLDFVLRGLHEGSEFAPNKRIHSLLLSLLSSAIVRGGKNLSKALYTHLDDLIHNQLNKKNTTPSPYLDVTIPLCLAAVSQFFDGTDPSLQKLIQTLFSRLFSPSCPSTDVQETIANVLPPLLRLCFLAKTLSWRSEYDNAYSLAVKSDNEVVRRGGSLALAAIVKANGTIPSINEAALLPTLKGVLEDNKSSVSEKQGVLFIVMSVSKFVGRVFEPFIQEMISVLLNCIGHSSLVIRDTALQCCSVLLEGISSYGIKMLLPQLIAQSQNDHWRTRVCSLQILSLLCNPSGASPSAPSATATPSNTRVLTVKKSAKNPKREKKGNMNVFNKTKKMTTSKWVYESLIQVIPILMECINDSHAKVKETAEMCIKNIIEQNILNPEIQRVKNDIFNAIISPNNTTYGILMENVLKISFVHCLDIVSFALLVILCSRCILSNVSLLKLRGTIILSTIIVLVEEEQNILPSYLPLLLPPLQSAILDANPEVRRSAALAYGNLSKKITNNNTVDDNNTLIPWFYWKLQTANDAVERSGLANALSEILVHSKNNQSLLKEHIIIILHAARNNLQYLHDYLKNNPVPNVDQVVANNANAIVDVRCGCIGMFVYLPSALGEQFSSFVQPCLIALLGGLGDELEAVRDVSLRAAEVLVRQFGTSHTAIILPALEEGSFADDWRVRLSCVNLLATLVSEVLRDFGNDPMLSTTANSNVKNTSGAFNTGGDGVSVLSRERKMFVLSSLYVAKNDENMAVRTTANASWKSLVHNTPRTLRELLPILMERLLKALSSSSRTKQRTASSCLGDIISKLSDKVLPELIPVIRDTFERSDASGRIGVCTGLSAIIENAPRTILASHIETLIPSMINSLMDPDIRVRQQGGHCACLLVEKMGHSAVNELVFSLLKKIVVPGVFSGEEFIASDRVHAVDGLKYLIQGQNSSVLGMTMRLLCDTHTSMMGVTGGGKKKDTSADKGEDEEDWQWVKTIIVGDVSKIYALSSVSSLNVPSVLTTTTQRIILYFSRCLRLASLQNEKTQKEDTSVRALEEVSKAVSYSSSLIVPKLEQDTIKSICDALLLELQQKTPKWDYSSSGLLKRQTILDNQEESDEEEESSHSSTEGIDVSEDTNEYQRFNVHVRIASLKLLHSLIDALGFHATIIQTECLTSVLPLCLADPSDVVRNCASQVIISLSKAIRKEEFSLSLADIQQSIQSLSINPVSFQREEALILPGMDSQAITDVIFPLYLNSLTYGTFEAREKAANGINDIINMSSDATVKTFVIKTTGVFIRIVGDKYPSNVKSAILEALETLLIRGSVLVRPFVPQLQTTFTKCLLETASVVRSRAVKCLVRLAPLATARAEALLLDILSQTQAIDINMKSTALDAMEKVINKWKGTSVKISETAREKILTTLSQLTYFNGNPSKYNSDIDYTTGNSACKALVAFINEMTDQDFYEQFVLEKILRLINTGEVCTRIMGMTLIEELFKAEGDKMATLLSGKRETVVRTFGENLFMDLKEPFGAEAVSRMVNEMARYCARHEDVKLADVCLIAFQGLYGKLPEGNLGTLVPALGGVKTLMKVISKDLLFEIDELFMQWLSGPIATCIKNLNPAVKFMAERLMFYTLLNEDKSGFDQDWITLFVDALYKPDQKVFMQEYIKRVILRMTIVLSDDE